MKFGKLIIKPPPFPSYPEMILAAVEALNKENGSNKSSISKYMKSTYGGLPRDHRALLNFHLAKMRDKGELVFWKNNYIKHDPNAPPRRGRGRPPKPKEFMASIAISSAPRPRGHQPKNPNGPPRPPKFKTSSGSARPRGRPRNMSSPAGGFGGTVPPPPTSRRPRGKPSNTKPPTLTGHPCFGV